MLVCVHLALNVVSSLPLILCTNLSNLFLCGCCSCVPSTSSTFLCSPFLPSLSSAVSLPCQLISTRITTGRVCHTPPLQSTSYLAQGSFDTARLICQTGNLLERQRWSRAYIFVLLFSILNSAAGTKQPIIRLAVWHMESRVICDLEGRHGAAGALTRHLVER